MSSACYLSPFFSAETQHVRVDKCGRGSFSNTLRRCLQLCPVTILKHRSTQRNLALDTALPGAFVGFEEAYRIPVLTFKREPERQVNQTVTKRGIVLPF